MRYAGLIINFNAKRLKEGIISFINFLVVKKFWNCRRSSCNALLYNKLSFSFFAI
jgi:hypothetical protein